MAQIQWCLVIAHCNQDVECTQDILQYPAPGNHQDLRQHSLPLHNGARPLTSSPDPSGHREAQTHLTHTVQDASTIAYKIILHRPPTQLPTAMPTTAHIYAKGRPRGWGRGTPESFTLVLTECEIHRSRCWLHSRRPRGTHNRGGAERVGGGCGKPIHFKQGTHTNWAGAGCSAARLRLPEAPLRVSQVRAEDPIHRTPQELPVGPPRATPTSSRGPPRPAVPAARDFRRHFMQRRSASADGGGYRAVDALPGPAAS